MDNKSQKITRKELREKYGVFGLSIIQIVGLILILSLVITIVYQFV